MSSPSKFWFPAKRYGWGWGPAVSWQGWAVLLAFAVLLGLGAFRFPPASHPLGFLAYAAGLCVLLVIICYAKGEPPGWRWGGK